jgi:hypothetical protein
MICHTEDVIAGQRLTPSQWKAERDKMVPWASLLPRDATAPLVEYLAKRYSDHEPPYVPVWSTPRRTRPTSWPGCADGPIRECAVRAAIPWRTKSRYGDATAVLTSEQNP